MRSSITDIKQRLESKASIWKRRPSEIRGYNRVLYTTTESGDYVRIDYNIKDKKVRLFVEDGDEGGNPYYSVINNGSITIERNATTGRVTSLHDKFAKRAKLISTIPNKEVIALINKNYGIGVKREKKSNEEIKKKKESVRKSELERTRKKYFKSESIHVYATEQTTETAVRLRKIILLDVVDIVIGVLLCACFYAYTYNFILSGVISAFFGVFTGIIDIYLRGRDPVFTKTIFFMIAGIALYIYGYYIL